MARALRTNPPLPPLSSTSPVHTTNAQALAPVISIREFKAHCQTCGMRELCLPVGFNNDEMRQFDAVVTHRTRLQKYESLYAPGDPFRALYAIQLGSLKTVVASEDGRKQIAGYHMPGEIIGFDGIANDAHRAGAIALQDAELCALPFTDIEHLARTMPALQRNLHRIMSREITRDHVAMLMLGSMRAEERVAAFLLNLADRYQRLGYSPTEYVLRMSREEIGSFIGLKLETVSRLLSRFHQEGYIHVQGRTVKLLNPGALKRIIG
jgi:CRP/FNR family transcriptional regulator, anaerobic regulatory protein